MAKRVQYLGNRKVKVDQMFRSRAVFFGKGDVQIVQDDKIAEKMERGTMGTVYRIVSDEEAVAKEEGIIKPVIQDSLSDLTIPEPLNNDEMVPARNASRNALAVYADSIGMMITDSMTRVEILDHIKSVRDSMDSPEIASQVEEEPEPMSAPEPEPAPTAYNATPDPAKVKKVSDLIREYMVNIPGSKKPTIRQLQKITGVTDKFVNAKLRDELWAEVQPLREQLKEKKDQATF